MARPNVLAAVPASPPYRDILEDTPNGQLLSNARQSTIFPNIVNTKLGWMSELRIDVQFSFPYATAAPTNAADGPDNWLGFDLILVGAGSYAGARIRKCELQQIKGFRELLRLRDVRWRETIVNPGGASGTATVRKEMVIPFDYMADPTNKLRAGVGWQGWPHMPSVDRVELRMRHQGHQSALLWATNGGNVSSMATDHLTITTRQYIDLPRDAIRSLRGAAPKTFAGFAAGDLVGEREAAFRAQSVALQHTEFREFEEDDDFDASEDLIVRLQRNKVFRTVGVLVDDASDGYEDGNLNDTVQAFRLSDSFNEEFLRLSEADVIQENENRYEAEPTGVAYKARPAGVYFLALDKQSDGQGLPHTEGRDLNLEVGANASLNNNSRLVLVTETVVGQPVRFE